MGYEKSSSLLLISGLVFIAVGSVLENASNRDQAQATPTTDSQDSAWYASMQQHSSLLANDFKSVSAVSSSGDLSPLNVFGQYLIYDTKGAIDDNDQFIVSTKYFEAQKEWRLALKDYNSAGKLIVKTGDEVLNNTDATADITNYTAYLNSGNQHANQSYALLNKA
jgi:hypothetical protein